MGLLKPLLIIISIVLVQGCTSSTHTMLMRTPAARKTNPNKIQVFYGEPPHRASPIATVAVARDGENATWAVEALKAEAAEIGADAITHLEMNYSTGIFPTLRVQGVAVRYD